MTTPARSLTDRLRDVMFWGDRLGEHLQGIERESFLQNPVLQDAAVRCLEVVGEAARHVMIEDPAAVEQLPALRQAYWTRNRVAHGYYDVDPAIVWDTATTSIPGLVGAIRRFIDERAS